MLKELANRIGELGNGKLIELLEEVLNELSDDILMLNKYQLEKGQKADGTLNRPYSERTKKIRQERGNPVLSNNIALYDLGSFWDSFWSDARSGKLIISAKDWKTDKLVAEYGETIFGLSDEHFKSLGEKAVPILKDKVHKFLRT